MRRLLCRFMTGCLGCRWHRYQQSTQPARLCDILWFWFLVVISGIILFWFYYWLISANSLENLNWYAFDQLKSPLPLYQILFALTCVTLAYILLLDVLSLCHFALGQQLCIHWVHRTVIVLTLISSAAVTYFADDLWKEGWQLQRISLMITGPFLHVSAVILMTILTWFISGWILDGLVAQSQHKVSHIVSRLICFGIYLSIMIGLYIVPVFIRSPCISAVEDLPRKPFLVAHKGASDIAPENTLAAFQYALKYNVITLESDVSISYDGVPFVLHDVELLRTTNVAEVFPSMKSMAACWFNMSQLKQLDAGSWFIKNNPFPGMPPLSESDKELFRNQTIPTLVELLTVAAQARVNVMFDIKLYDEGAKCRDHPFYNDSVLIVIKTIKDFGFPDEKMWWLYHDKLNISTNFTSVGNNLLISPKTLHADGIQLVNFGFSQIFWDQISTYREENISVNMYVVDSTWLFSLYWCMGVSSITTNKSPTLYDLNRPVWHLTPQDFKTLWLTTDLVSVVIVILIWIAQDFRRHGFPFNRSSTNLLTRSHNILKEELIISDELTQDPVDPQMESTRTYQMHPVS